MSASLEREDGVVLDLCAPGSNALSLMNVSFFRGSFNMTFAASSQLQLGFQKSGGMPPQLEKREDLGGKRGAGEKRYNNG